MQPIYKSIVAKLPIEDTLLNAVSVGLIRTGVVMGKFGMADALKTRRAAIPSWREDPDEKVRHSADKQVKQLERMIAAEQKRAQKDLERRKREWGPATPTTQRAALHSFLHKEFLAARCTPEIRLRA